MSASRARLFVAADLPDRVCEQLAGWAREHLGQTPQLRPLDAANLHVTLCFLGWRDEAEIEALGRASVACARPAGHLSLAAPAWHPASRPRVMAVDLVDGRGQLAALQRLVSRQLESTAGYVPERRAFRPHVSLARVRSGARLPPGGRPNPPRLRVEPFQAQALTLYRSRLGRAGARYQPVARVELS